MGDRSSVIVEWFYCEQLNCKGTENNLIPNEINRVYRHNGGSKGKKDVLEVARTYLYQDGKCDACSGMSKLVGRPIWDKHREFDIWDGHWTERVGRHLKPVSGLKYAKVEDATRRAIMYDVRDLDDSRGRLWWANASRATLVEARRRYEIALAIAKQRQKVLLPTNHPEVFERYHMTVYGFEEALQKIEGKLILNT